jgi:hypothetical protein
LRSKILASRGDMTLSVLRISAVVLLTEGDVPNLRRSSTRSILLILTRVVTISSKRLVTPFLMSIASRPRLMMLF